MNRTDFQGTLGNQEVDLYSLTNNKGLNAAITNYGARLVELQVPDKEGNMDNIIVGHPSMKAFLDNEEKYFGAVIGRFANRIAEGKFVLDGNEYKLSKNMGSHHLHGGPVGFHNVVWGANQVDNQTLQLSHQSKDGVGGYPGNIGVRVTYKLTNQNKLEISFEAESDERTILNMTHHPYYNLHGTSSGASVDDHLLTIQSDSFLKVDEMSIPTGEILPVENSPLDFQEPKLIGKERRSFHEYLQYTNGYNHNFILNQNEARGLSFAAYVEESESGRSITIHTTEPGLQFYTCQQPVDHIDSAFCLEPQHFPDAPNHSHFPSTVIDAYETYHWKTVLTFNN